MLICIAGLLQAAKTFTFTACFGQYEGLHLKNLIIIGFMFAVLTGQVVHTLALLEMFDIYALPESFVGNYTL